MNRIFGWLRSMGLAGMGLLAFPVYAQYNVGQVDLQFKDAARNNRKVDVTMLYPASAEGYDAPMLQQNFPLVLFAHGFSIPVRDYVEFAGYIAEAGYIVWICDSENGLSPSHEKYARDLVFLKSQASVSANSGILPANWNAPVGIMGHSMGGGAAILAAALDSTFSCVVGLAAAETKPSAIAASKQYAGPLLLICGAGDSVVPIRTNQKPIYDSSASACKYLVAIEGAGHCELAGGSKICGVGDLTSGSENWQTYGSTIKLVFYYLYPWLEATLGAESLSAFGSNLAPQKNIQLYQICN